jgi:predicted nucleotidyltransferase component of viral defense system
MKPHYSKQVDLLLTVLSDVMRSPDIALKGGTAINLFLLDMPRLSVDIDLAYLKILPREDSLKAMHDVMTEIAERLSSYPNLKVETKYTQDRLPKQILVKQNDISIKIELNLVIRGAVFDPIPLEICEKARTLYKKEITVQGLSFEDLYAGKFCASLDRQHPRDLFDVLCFFEKFALTEKLKNAFLVYLLSTSRPIHEILQPSLLDQQAIYESEFESMTDEPITYVQLEQARVRLIEMLNKALSPQDKDFLISFEQGDPQWDLFPITHAKDLPAVKWKLHNVNQMDAEKRSASVVELERKLGITMYS